MRKTNEAIKRGQRQKLKKGNQQRNTKTKKTEAKQENSKSKQRQQMKFATKGLPAAGVYNKTTQILFHLAIATSLPRCATPQKLQQLPTTLNTHPVPTTFPPSVQPKVPKTTTAPPTDSQRAVS